VSKSNATNLKDFVLIDLSCLAAHWNLPDTIVASGNS